MYTGITAHHNAKRVASYADAVAAFEAASLTPTGKQRRVKPDGFPLGGHAKSVTWVRQEESGAVVFMLYSTDVVVWSPDNSVEIDNYGTVTTSGFASRFLPSGIHLNYPVARRGSSGGHKTITYVSDRDGVRSYNVCHGGLVRFVEHADVWLPDEDTLDTMKFPELDRARCRALALKYHLRDFEMWLSMAPMHLDIEHEGWDLGHVAMALKHRDFATAAAHLPLIKPGSGFGTAKRINPLPIRTRSWEQHVTMGSLSKLKLALWEDEEMLDDVKFKTMPQDEFNRAMRRVREMEALGLDVHNYGPG